MKVHYEFAVKPTIVADAGKSEVYWVEVAKRYSEQRELEFTYHARNFWQRTLKKERKNTKDTKFETVMVAGVPTVIKRNALTNKFHIPPMPKAVYEAAKPNWEANTLWLSKGDKCLDANLFKKSDWEIVYLVMNGPSLEKNWEALKNVKRGVVMSCNRGLYTIPTEYLDYLMIIDPRGYASWTDKEKVDASKTTALFDFAAPAACRTNSNFKEYYWFNSMFHENYVNRKAWSLYESVNISSPMVHLAFLMGAKHIVFVGADYALGKDGRVHNYEDTKNFSREGVHEVVGVDGTTWETKPWMRISRDIMVQLCWMMQLGAPSDDSITCYNASEAGILQGVYKHKRTFQKSEIFKIRTLEKVVEEMNALPKGECFHRGYLEGI